MVPVRRDAVRWLVFVLCATLGAACASNSVDTDESPPELSTQTVDCDSIIDVVDTLPDSYVEFARALAMPLPPDGMQVGRSEDGFRFSKFGMAIRAGTEAVISIEPAEGDAYLGHGGRGLVSSPGNAQALRFLPCPSSAGAWVIHVGGIWSTNDGCIRIGVTSGQASDQASLGIRAAC